MTIFIASVGIWCLYPWREPISSSVIFDFTCIESYSNYCIYSMTKKCSDSEVVRRLRNDILFCLWWEYLIVNGPLSAIRFFAQQYKQRRDMDYYAAIRTMMQLGVVLEEIDESEPYSLTWNGSGLQQFIMPFRHPAVSDLSNLSMSTQFIYDRLYDLLEDRSEISSVLLLTPVDTFILMLPEPPWNDLHATDIIIEYI